MPRILHVEDDIDFTQITQALIDDIADYTEVHTLAEARVLLAQQQFDIVLLDLNLPDGSGLTLLDIIEQQHAQIIVFSGQEPDFIDNSHVSAVLTKAKTSDEQLLSTIKKIIDHTYNGAQI
jgi:CheY-like chemotaxis protein